MPAFTLEQVSDVLENLDSRVLNIEINNVVAAASESSPGAYWANDLYEDLVAECTAASDKARQAKLNVSWGTKLGETAVSIIEFRAPVIELLDNRARAAYLPSVRAHVIQSSAIGGIIKAHWNYDRMRGKKLTDALLGETEKSRFVVIPVEGRLYHHDRRLRESFDLMQTFVKRFHESGRRAGALRSSVYKLISESELYTDLAKENPRIVEALDDYRRSRGNFKFPPNYNVLMGELKETDPKSYQFFQMIESGIAFPAAL